jgi:hypothetical protein
MTVKSVSDKSVDTLLARWREQYGPLVHKLRSSKIREIIEVQYQGGQGRLERDNFALSWDIVLSPDDKVEPKYRPEDVTRVEDLAAPNLRDSLKQP